MSLVIRMNQGPIRTPARSIANLEFHAAGHETNDVARAVVTALGDRGFGAINPSMGFPMEMEHFPGKLWVVSHKPVAAAAGLGTLGIHRNLIHPRFGSFILLGTVVTDAEVEEQGEPLDYNPCVECKLCVSACPVGAIKKDGAFDFSACYTHNYREFMGGFTSFVEQIADAKDKRDLRRRVTDDESASWWQSLSYGANYKAAYCLAVCPAGEDVINPFLDDRRGFLDDVVKPLTQKEEKVFVVRGSDAEAHVTRRFPHKAIRHVPNSLRATNVPGLLRGMQLVFQRERAKNVTARYHFTFTGEHEGDVTIAIDRGSLEILDGHAGAPDVRIVADAATWIGFLRKERSLLWALLTRCIRIRGRISLMKSFAACFLAE